MSARDRLSIVAYDTDVSTVLPLVAMDHDGKRVATQAVPHPLHPPTTLHPLPLAPLAPLIVAAQAIRAIKAGSQTNLSGGLLQGM